MSGTAEILGMVEPGSKLGMLASTLDSWGFTIIHTRISVLTLIVAILVIALLAILAHLSIKVANWLIGKMTHLDMAQRLLAQKLVSITVWIVIFLLGVDALGIDLTALALFSGAFGLALGFGFQKTFGNLLAGIILLMDRSIKPGDVIAVNDGVSSTVGQVKKIGIRAVSVITRDKKEYLIPNENLMINQVENWSYSSRNVRIRVPVTVHLEADIDLAESLMITAASAAARVLKEPPPSAWLTQFTENGVSYEVSVWINDPEEGLANVRSDILKRVWALFRENGIAIPNRADRQVRLRNSETLEELLTLLRERG